ncbi:MAG: NAD-dependent epimerase/dehydratase family protein [Hyphomonadaceae bacterium]
MTTGFDPHLFKLVTVFGYGPTGAASVRRLLDRGVRVRVAQRSRPGDLPPGVEFRRCDVLDARQVLEAMDGASQAVVTLGFEYVGKAWRAKWPVAMANLLAAAETTGARIVQIDNLYMYGPQDAPLREDMPLTSRGLKPAARAKISRMWLEASESGRVKFAALRAPDFYGPGVRRSHMGDTGLAAVAEGRTATLLMKPDLPHAFAYVPDIARAVETLLDAPDDAYGQAWHVPCAPAMSPRAMLEMGARTIGAKPRVVALPPSLLPVLGIVSGFVAELAEMRFQFDRAYDVDWSKWAGRFWSDPTSFDAGVAATMRSYGQAVRLDTAHVGARMAT